MIRARAIPGGWPLAMAGPLARIAGELRTAAAVPAVARLVVLTPADDPAREPLPDSHRAGGSARARSGRPGTGTGAGNGNEADSLPPTCPHCGADVLPGRSPSGRVYCMNGHGFKPEAVR